jgi:serine/threonine protein kinase/Tol biopolymer transport system component
MSVAPGTQIGPYEIVALLGAGGMGEVYRARDTRLKREVAVKVLPQTFARDTDRCARFRREAELLATLNHPHIAALYGLEEAGDLTALVLELVEGPTLADRLTEGTVPLDEALPIARQIAEALEAAHEKGIIHRDLKPANIKLRPDGTVKILDFGLAKSLEPTGVPSVIWEAPTALSPAPTLTGVIVGTPTYMPPEQARGKPVDKRADIWAFGCVLYEMLTGKRPFPGEIVTDTLAAIIHNEPDWQALPHRTPQRIQSLIVRCLRKDPAQRLRDIADGRFQIEEVLNDPGTSEARSRTRFGWRTLAVVAAAFVGGIAMAGAWLLQSQKPTLPNPLENALFSRVTNFEGTERSAAISRDGRFVAFRSDQDGPLDVWLTQIGTGRFLNVTKGIDDEFATDTPSCGFSADGSEIWVSGGPGRRLRVLPLMGGTPRPFLSDSAVAVAWSPDGTRIVYHLQDAGDSVFVADRTGANARQIFRRRANEHNHFLIWSVDGRWIYFTSGTPETKEMDLWRVSPDGGSRERLTTHNSDVAYPTPIDSRTVVYVSHDEDGSGPWLWAIDVERKLTRRVSFGVEKYLSVAATPDGSQLAATVANPSASLWSVPIFPDHLAEEADVKPFRLSTAHSSAPRFGAGPLFYLSSLGAGDGVWRFHDGQSTEIWKGADGSVLSPPDVSRDGQKVAIILRRNGKLRLHVLSAEGGELRALADSIDVRGAASWSPDGKWIVVRGNEDGSPGLFKIPADGGKPIRLTTGVALNPVWSPDGNVIAYGGPNVSSLAPLLAIRPDGAPVRLSEIKLRRDGERLRFAPDGSLIYMQGELRAQNFWRLDLATMTARPLTRLQQRDAMRTFDVTADGKQIIFDRLRDNSDIVLIDRRTVASR